MPVIDGIEATRRIVADPATHNVRVIVLTTFDLDDYVYGALRAGASGFLLKDTTPEDLTRAIQLVAAGGALLAPTVTRRLVAEFASRPSTGNPGRAITERLTAREIEVLRLVARGLSNAELAQELVLSPLTAKTHVSRILDQTGPTRPCSTRRRRLRGWAGHTRTTHELDTFDESPCAAREWSERCM